MVDSEKEIKNSFFLFLFRPPSSSSAFFSYHQMPVLIWVQNCAAAVVAFYCWFLVLVFGFCTLVWVLFFFFNHTKSDHVRLEEVDNVGKSKRAATTKGGDIYFWPRKIYQSTSKMVQMVEFLSLNWSWPLQQQQQQQFVSLFIRVKHRTGEGQKKCSSF